MPIQSTQMDPFSTILWVIVGILLSLSLPMAVRVLNQSKLERRHSIKEILITIWEKYGGKTYFYILISATIIALVIVFLMDLKFYLPREAVLVGFAWESFINKLYVKREEIADN